MYKYFIKTTILLGLVLLVNTAYAAKIGYVDARRLIDESPQGIDQIATLNSQFEARDVDIKEKAKYFQDQKSDFEKNSVLLSADEAEARTAELRALQRSLERAQRDFRDEYTVARNKSLAELQKLISDAVIFVAERDKYDLIVQQVVYASDSINLTDTVLKELKKRAKQ